MGVTPLGASLAYLSRDFSGGLSDSWPEGWLLSQSDQRPLWMQGEETVCKTFPLTGGPRSSLPIFEKSWVAKLHKNQAWMEGPGGQCCPPGGPWWMPVGFLGDSWVFVQ